MFKKFDKVFKFTFKNQVKAKGYKSLTIILALVLFLLPVLIFWIVDMASGSSEDEAIASCGAERIYVVNEITPNADYSLLNQLQVPNYEQIDYQKADNVDEILKQLAANPEPRALVLRIYKDSEENPTTTLIVPQNSILTTKDAANFNTFLDRQNQAFTILASGIPFSSMEELMRAQEKDVFNTEGYKTGTSIYETDAEMLEDKNNSSILPVFNMILVYVTVMIVYFVVLYYGASINQNVVLEKSSKLMDTMLISLSPDSLIFGKLLGVLAAGFIQFFLWIAAIAGGVFAGVKLVDTIDPGNNLPVITFLKSFSKLGLFKPGSVIIAVLVLIFGIVLYCALAAIGGAISNTKEEAASNQGIFVILLVVCFYLILMTGLDTTDVPTWLYLFPGTAAMILPAGICSGMVSNVIALISFGLMLATTLFALWIAGKLYKMMSLYKGNKVTLTKALKMLTGKV